MILKFKKYLFPPFLLPSTSKSKSLNRKLPLQLPNTDRERETEDCRKRRKKLKCCCCCVYEHDNDFLSNSEKKTFLCASNTAKFLPFYASLLSLDLFLHGTYLWIFSVAGVMTWKKFKTFKYLDTSALKWMIFHCFLCVCVLRTYQSSSVLLKFLMPHEVPNLWWRVRKMKLPKVIFKNMIIWTHIIKKKVHHENWKWRNNNKMLSANIYLRRKCYWHSHVSESDMDKHTRERKRSRWENFPF